MVTANQRVCKNLIRPAKITYDEAMRLAKLILKWVFALIFILAGIMHFAVGEFFVRIMPPIFPFPFFWVYLSGTFELILGIMLLVPRFTRIAAWGLVILLIAVFPANIYMALNPQIFTDFTPTALYLRLPLQFVLIGWAFWLTKTNGEV